jgi:hypothetical protein
LKNNIIRQKYKSKIIIALLTINQNIISNDQDLSCSEKLNTNTKKSAAKSEEQPEIGPYQSFFNSVEILEQAIKEKKTDLSEYPQDITTITRWHFDYFFQRLPNHETSKNCLNYLKKIAQEYKNENVEEFLTATEIALEERHALTLRILQSNNEIIERYAKKLKPEKPDNLINTTITESPLLKKRREKNPKKSS